MLWEAIQGLQILHWGLLIFAVVGFFTFWARTRFWLPTLSGSALIVAKTREESL
jgi:energy-converting hydrogenase Eha subunit G